MLACRSRTHTWHSQPSRYGSDWAARRPAAISWLTATTRPETILGDTAVAVHPEDERYAHLVGRLVRIPFVERDVPIITDEFVEREFGTGAVKVTPAHDHTDFETGVRHDLPRIDVMTDEATMNAAAGPYEGLSREECRARILEDLDAAGDLVEVHAAGGRRVRALEAEALVDRARALDEPRDARDRGDLGDDLPLGVHEKTDMTGPAGRRGEVPAHHPGHGIEVPLVAHALEDVAVLAH